MRGRNKALGRGGTGWRSGSQRLCIVVGFAGEGAGEGEVGGGWGVGG